MRSSMVLAITTTVVVAISAVSLEAQTLSTATTVKSAGSVSGRVTIKGKGVAGIVVALRRSEGNSPFETPQRAISDQDGNYKITNVTQGAYDVVVGGLVFVVVDNNNARGRSIIVGDGEAIEDINFALVRGGVITGKITDADGRPVIQQQVRLFRADSPTIDSRPPQPARIAFPVSTQATDDRGIYRFYGLSPGRYKMSVGRRDQSFSGFNPPGSVSYKEVFYPDATEQTKATVIEVTEGSESANIDITVGKTIETFSASGRIIDGQRGQPVPNVRLGLRRLFGERAEFMSSLMISNNNGEFVTERLIPGKYGVFLMPEANADARADNTTFEIIDADVSGITVRVIKGASISGVVVLESDDKRALSRLSQFQVQGYVPNPGSGDGMGNSSRSTVSADGSFRLGGLPTGTANLSLGPVMGMDQMKGFMITRIEREGVLQPDGIELKEGEQVTGVRLIVSYGNATLRGIVHIENGPLPPNTRILVQLMKPGDASSRVRPSIVDERGHFIAEGIPAGSYELWVWVTGNLNPPPLPTKQPVTLQDGIVTEVAVTLDLAARRKP